MSFEIEGKLHKIFDTESKSESFQAREIVLETLSGTYTQLLKFQLTQDRCEIADRFKENDEVKIYFDLRGREWNGKYFTNLNAWKIENKVDGPADSAPLPSDASEAFPEPSAPDDPFGDLPF